MPTLFQRRLRKTMKVQGFVRKKKTNTSRINTLARKVHENEPPVRYSVEAISNLDIFDTPVVRPLQVSAVLPTTSQTARTLLKSIKVSGQCKLINASDTTEIARIVIVQDRRKFDNNAAPTWLDIFKENTVYSLRADTLSGDKKGSFHVLFDRTITLNNDTATLSNLKIFKYNKIFRPPIEQYNYDEYSKNLLYLMYMATSATTEMDMNYQNSVIMAGSSF